jgi:predicted dehydrogenase
MFQRRSSGAATILRRVIRSRLFGDAVAARFGFGGPRVVVGSGFRGDPVLARGGVLLESGIHGVDLMSYVLDARNVSVEEVQVETEGGLDVHVRASGTFQLVQARDIPFKVLVTGLDRVDEGLIISFEHGTVHLDINTLDLTVQPNGSRERYRLLPSGGQQHATTASQCAFVHWASYLTMISGDGKINETAVASTVVTSTFLDRIYSNESLVRDTRR